MLFPVRVEVYPVNILLLMMLYFPVLKSTFVSFFLFFPFLFFFLAALGLCCCAWAFSSCSEQGLLFVAVHGLLIVVTSLVVEHGL